MPRPPAIPTAPEGLRDELAPSEGGLSPEVRDMASSEIDFPDDEPSASAGQSGPDYPQPVSRQPTQQAPGDPVVFPDEAPKLESVYQQVQHLDPERSAQVIQLAKSIDQPEAYVDKNLENVKRVAQAPSTSFFTQLEQQYPETAKFLAEPKNMVVTHDDLPNLAEHEALVRDVKTAHGIVENFQAGWQSSLHGVAMRASREATGTPSSFVAAALRAWSHVLIPGTQYQGSPADQQTGLEHAAALAGGLSGDLPSMAAVGAATGGLGPLASMVSSFAIPAGFKQALVEHLQKGDLKSASDFWSRAYDISKESVKQGAVGLATWLTGGTAGLVANAALAKALPSLLESFGPAAADAIGVAVPAVAKLGGEALMMPTAAAAEEGRLPTRQDLVDSVATIGGLHLLTGGLESALSLGDRLHADKSAESGEFYDHLGNLAEQSKLRERSPEQYGQHLDSLVQGSSAETVYIPAKDFEQYFQGKKIDPAAVAGELGVTDSLSEARETGGSVQIPLSKFAQAFAGTEHWQGLKDDVKFDADDLTSRELTERQSEVAKATQQAEAAADTTNVVPTDSETTNVVREGIAKQLEAAGLSPEEVKHNAELFESVYTRMAQRTSMPAEEFYKRFPVTVERSDAAPGGGLEQAGRPVEGDLGTRASERPLPEQVPVASLKTDKSFEGLQPKEIRARSLEDAKALTRGSVMNKAEGWDIKISGEGLKKAANYAVRPEQALGLKNLRELIENAQYVRSDASRTGVTHDYLYSPFEHDGREYLAKIVIENVPENKGGRGTEGHRKFYSLHVQEIDRSSAGRASRPPRPTAEADGRNADERTIPLQDLLVQINKARETTELFQPGAAVAPPFYSRLTRTIEEKMGNSATADQVRGIIKEIKPEERKWLGVDEFLQGKEKVSKPELLEFLRANQLEVHEVTKGTSFDPSRKVEIDELKARRAEIEESFKKITAEYPTVGDIQRQPEHIRQQVENLQDQVEAIDNRIADHERLGESDSSKFSKYTLPGGENYREVLFTLPTKMPTDLPEGFSFREAKGQEKNLGDILVIDTDGKIAGAGDTKEEALANVVTTKRNSGKLDSEYRSSHWDEPNVLAHVRLNDRTDADGKKVLFVEEIQSDWHQEGRKKGYVPQEYTKELQKEHTALKKEINSAVDKIREDFLKETGTTLDFKEATDFAVKEGALTREQIDRHYELRDISDGKGLDRVPDAPFRKTWHEFALKRILRMAAEGGYDRVAWTNGEQQAERYDLSKQISEIEYIKNDDGTYSIDAKGIDDGEGIGDSTARYTPEQLEGVVGKELTQKIVNGDGKKYRGRDGRTLEGLDLKVGGEGMKGFYDKILPDFANKFGKKYGAKVGESGIRTGEGETFQYNGTAPTSTEARNISKQQDARVAAQLRQIAHEMDKSDVPFKELMEKFGSPAAAEAVGGSMSRIGGESKVHSLDITPALKDAAINEGFSLFQPGDEQGPRGRIRIGNSDLSIDLFKTADRSTFLHEMGHAFLEMMGQLAGDANAPQDIKDDYRTIQKFLGIDPDAAEFIGLSPKETIGVDGHEKFARAFETYLSEGKAPTTKLQAAFDRFSDWLVGVYGDVKKALGIELSPEIRDVMDRMVATKEEIEKARTAIGQRAEIIKGLPPEVARRLSDLEDQSRRQAESTLLKEQMKELTEKNKDFLAKERERVTEAATAEVKEIPVYKASDEVRGNKRLTAATLADRFLEGKLKHEDIAAFEVAAERNGFASGEDLARQILEADTQGGFEKEVKDRVDVDMQKHAALMDTDAIRQKALEAVHSDRSTELLALERQALQDLVKTATVRTEASRRNRIEASIEAASAKRQAEAIISKKPVKDVKPGPYITAERNAAVRVSKAIAKGDFEAAAEAKREQLVNHALAGEAMRAQKEAQKTIDFLADKAKEGRDFTKMPYAFARQVDQLLSRFGFKDASSEDLSTLSQIAETMLRNGEDASAIANATGLKDTPSGAWQFETLPDFIARQNESYFATQLPDVILGADKPFRSLSTAELSDLKDAVKTLTTLGKNRDRFLEAFNTADINEAGKKFAASVEENFGHPEARNLQLGSAYTSKAEKILGTLAQVPKVLARWMDTMLTTCNKLDGLKTDGPAKEFIYRKMSEAEGKRLARTRDELAALDGVFGKHFKEGELDDYKNAFVKVNDNNVSKLELLSMALNWGNLGNRDRVMRGFGLTEGEVEGLLFKNLSKRDFDFAQDTWNYLEKFKPEIKALEMDVNGVEPKFVEPSPIMTPWGAYEGGYYPISYDPDRSASAFRNTEQTTALFKQYGAAKAQTEQGHVIARVNSLKRPIKLSLDVLTGHIEDVIHDLEYRKPVIDVARFLNQKDAKSALVNALGVRGYNSINDWLKAVASGPSEPLHFGEGAARWLRFRATMFYMGYRLASVPKIAIENLNNISSELGVSDAARAMKDYYMGESGQHEFVVGKSEFMRQRAEHLDRDMSDVYDKYAGEKTALGSFHKFAFWTHAILDQGVSFPLWTHVFKEAMAADENVKLATQKADEAVKRTFMSGGTVDQAAIMRGSESQKALTVALGYQSMMWNRYSQQLFATGQAASQGRYMDAAMIAARAHFYSFVMPAAIAVLTHEMVRNSQGSGSDDEKKRSLGTALKEVTPLKFIPVARDVFPYFIDKSLGQHGSDLQVTPLERAAQTILDPAAEVFKSAFTGQSLSPKFGEKVTNALSLTVPIPKEVDDVVFNFLDWQRDHGALTWRDFVSRKTKH